MPIIVGKAHEASKTFELTPKDAASLIVSDRLLMGRVGSLNRVVVQEITYADGSQWQPAGNERCSIPISRFVPASSR